MGFFSTLAQTLLVAFGFSSLLPPNSPPMLQGVEYIFTFGDSYTSEGWNGTGDPLLSVPRRCSTAGPTWARQLTDAVHTKLINLAVSGATSNQDIVYSSVPDFRSQTTSFMDYILVHPEKVGWNSSDSIFMITLGTNDIYSSYDNSTRNGAALYSRDLNSYFTTVNRLYIAGARKFVFNNVVPYDRAPMGVALCPVTQAKLAGHIREFNAQLSAKAAAFCGARPDVTCMVFDTYTLFAHIMDNPSDFGFASPSKLCNSYASRKDCTIDKTIDPTCLGPVDRYVWKDDVHPTWAAHKWWAEELIEKLRR